jgi:hypothetical protein
MIFDNWKKEHQLILEKILNFASLSDNEDIQRKKFSLLTELFLKLYTKKNYKGDFRNTSNLILLFLCIYKNNYPVDIFSKKKGRNPESKRDISELKRILKQELRNTISVL